MSDDAREARANHGASEKQRRDRINSKIDELRALVPAPAGKGGEGEEEKSRSKLSVLQQSIDLIKSLQTTVSSQAHRLQRLQAEACAGRAADGTAQAAEHSHGHGPGHRHSHGPGHGHSHGHLPDTLEGLLLHPPPKSEVGEPLGVDVHFGEEAGKELMVRQNQLAPLCCPFFFLTPLLASTCKSAVLTAADCWPTL